jgi:hypothetical protein
MLVVFASHASAQNDVIALQDRLQRLKEQLQNRQTEVQQLLDSRIRLDMGLPVYFRPVPENVRAMPIDQAKEQLIREEAEVSSLMDSLQSLRSELGRKAPSRTQGELPDIVYDIPGPGDPAPSLPPWNPLPPPEPRPGPGTQFSAKPVPTPINDDPVIMIRGSPDRSAVARSLYNVAASYLREARRLREVGDIEQARELDGKARVRLEIALRELEPLVAVDNPAYVDLFHQGKCLEEQFHLDSLYAGLKDPGNSRAYAQRYEALRQPFAAIRAMDQEVVDGNKILGPFARSADFALKHIQWMGDYGDYMPTIEIDSIIWIRKK